MAKYRTARIAKKGAFKYGCFACNSGSCSTCAASFHGYKLPLWTSTNSRIGRNNNAQNGRAAARTSPSRRTVTLQPACVKCCRMTKNSAPSDRLRQKQKLIR